MRKACIIGHPIGHSLSPYLHKFWLNKYAINGIFDAHDVHPDTFITFIENFAQLPYEGAFVTVPHKETLFHHAHIVSDNARIIKAANMAYYKNNQLHADNSDWYGYYASLYYHPIYQQYQPKKAAILGAGGAARGVILGLHKLGITHVTIINRTLEKASAIADDFKQYFTSIAAVSWDEKDIYVNDSSLIVNTTSLGLNGEDIDINFATIAPNTIINDIVYNPLLTPFLTQASRNNLPIIDGLNMLIYQAIPGFQKYYHNDIMPETIDDMRKFLCARLG